MKKKDNDKNADDLQPYSIIKKIDLQKCMTCNQKHLGSHNVFAD